LPYELSYSTKVFEKAWSELGSKMGVKESMLKKIRDSAEAARSAHRHINWLKIGLVGGGIAALCAVGGWFAAPALASMLGTAAGLSGAAAVAHGLALLGGGTLAAGGAGMAGGMWLVTTAAAGAAGLFATTAQVAFSMGKQQFMTEVVKLQVSLKVRVAEQQLSVAVAQSKIAELQEQRKKLEKILEEERLLNDENSQRLKDLEAKVQAVTDALKWLRKEVA
jgi:molybdopterin converting factor small subunit